MRRWSPPPDRPLASHAAKRYQMARARSEHNRSRCNRLQSAVRMSIEPIVKPALSPPIDSRMRWWVLLALCGLSFLTIVDRVCISAAKNDIASDLTVSDQTFGFVFGAFALGYALFMVPSGWAADRLGPRKFLAIIVAAWSIFTIATGLALAVPMLIAIRFLFGGAEAGPIRLLLGRSTRGCPRTNAD